MQGNIYLTLARGGGCKTISLGLILKFNYQGTAEKNQDLPCVISISSLP